MAVFVCTFDPLGAGLRRYTVRRTVLETGELFPDRQRGILLSTVGSGYDVPDDLALFLRYVGRGAIGGTCGRATSCARSTPR